jgi:sulfhydrogenase subunit delta
MNERPKIGIFTLTSCGGDQLVILDCEAELLDIAELVSIEEFLLAGDDAEKKGRLDIALVEGSVVTPADLELLKDVRRRSGLLLALGTCATCGGLPAGVQTQEGAEKALGEVMGKGAQKTFPVLNPSPLKAHVPVDFEIPGCPIEKKEFLYALGALLRGAFPDLRITSVCAECIYKSNVCLLIERRQPCLGPITRGGCDARCPSKGDLCIACRGPVEEANMPSYLNALLERGHDLEKLKRICAIFWGAELHRFDQIVEQAKEVKWPSK